MRCASRPSGTARPSSGPRSRSPSATPRMPWTPSSAPSRREDPARARQPRHEHHGPGPADRGDRPRAGSARRRHARRRGARAGHGAGGPGVDRGRVLDRQRPQVAVRPEGRRDAPRPLGLAPPDPAAGRRRTARTTRAPTGRRYPPAVGLAGHRRPHAVPHDPRRAPLRRRARPGRLARPHGGEQRAGADRARQPRRRPRHPAAGAGRDDRLDGGDAPAVDRRRGRRGALQRALFDEEGIEVPIGRWPVPAAREPGDPGRATVIRISAQRYVRAEEFEHLGRVLAARRPR